MKIYWELFSVFMRIGAFTFGGGYAMLPLIQKSIGPQKRKLWITMRLRSVHRESSW